MAERRSARSVACVGRGAHYIGRRAVHVCLDAAGGQAVRVRSSVYYYFEVRGSSSGEAEVRVLRRSRRRSLLRVPALLRVCTCVRACLPACVALPAGVCVRCVLCAQLVRRRLALPLLPGRDDDPRVLGNGDQGMGRADLHRTSYSQNPIGDVPPTTGG